MIKLFSIIFLLFEYNFCSFDDGFYEKWLNKYRLMSGNEHPPSKYKEWVQLARELKVSFDPSDYKAVFRDISNFKNFNLSAEKLQKYLAKIRMNDRDVDGGTGEQLIAISRMNQWRFGDALLHISRVIDPKIPFYYLSQGYDEGMVMPDEKNEEELYGSMKDIFRRIPEFQKEHQKYANKCMLLQAPCSFVIFPYNIPIFSSNRLRGMKDIILPTSRTGLPAYKKHLDTALNAPKWEEKIKRAVFRGTTTGINFRNARKEQFTLTNNPRFKLHEMSIHQREGKLNCSVPLDFGITEFNQFNEDYNYQNMILKRFPFVPVLDFTVQFKNKYLIVVDGHAWPDRLAFYMASGSLVFLATLQNEWVIDQVIDGENIVLVNPDLSNLVEKLEWAAQNDAEAQRIAENGKKFALEKFGSNNQQAYTALLVMEYQNLFKNTNNTDKFRFKENKTEFL